MQDNEKPHKGRIINWSMQPCHKEQGSLGFYITGRFMDHPLFASRSGHTSFVVKHDAATNEIETRNSRYTLVGNGYV